MTQRTTIRLKGDLLAAAKRRAAEQGRTLTAFIEDAVRAALAAPAKPSRERKPLPISKETGGPWPGVDLIHTHALETEWDIERMKELEARLEQEARRGK